MSQHAIFGRSEVRKWIARNKPHQYRDALVFVVAAVVAWWALL